MKGLATLLRYSCNTDRNNISRLQVPKVYFYCVTHLGSTELEHCVISQARTWLTALGIYCGEEFARALGNSRKTTAVVMRRSEVTEPKVVCHDRSFPQAWYDYMIGNCEVWVLEDLLLAIKLSQSGKPIDVGANTENAIISTAFAFSTADAQKEARKVREAHRSITATVGRTIS